MPCATCWQEAEPFYHDYKVSRGGGSARGDRRCGLAAGAGRRWTIRSTTKTHHPLVRQTDHRRNGQAVDGHSHAAQLLQPGNLFSGRLSGAIALDGQNPTAPRRTGSRSSRRSATSLTLRRTGPCGRSPTTVAA